MPIEVATRTDNSFVSDRFFSIQRFEAKNDCSRLPLSNHNRLSSGDLYEIRDHMCAAVALHRIFVEGAGAPDIAFRHNQAAIGSIDVHATEYNSEGRIVIEAPAFETSYLVHFPIAGRAEISQGRKTYVLCPGEMCLLDPSLDVRQRFDPDFRHLTLKLAKAKIDSLLSAELGFCINRVDFQSGPIPLTGRAFGLARMIANLCEDIEAGGAILDHPRMQASIEDMIMRLILLAVPHDQTERFENGACVAAPHYVCRAIEYIEAHADETIVLQDLVEASGVSARSLHESFRRFRGTTPMGYVKTHRLALAREALSRCWKSGESITEIALACGFAHLSRFTQDYFRRYGEKPSDTKRAASVRPLSSPTDVAL